MAGSLVDDQRTEAPLKRKVPKRKRHRFGLIAIIVLLPLLVGGYFLWRYLGSYESTDDAQVSADIVPIGTRVAGQVTSVAIKENQLVKKGDLIAEIDEADYVAREKQAEAELATAEAQVFDAEGKLLASGRGTYFTAPPK